MLQRLLTSLALLLLALLPVQSTAGLPERPLFGQETSDLAPDAAARFGTLPNGVRYVVLANHEPRTRASLRLVVMAGSLHETDDQQGLAHFLEHMAFNGSAHYAPGTLIEFFQRMGMNFGGDTNAHTSFDHTAYLLELPKTDAATTDEGLKVFSDYAQSLLLLDTEIDRERGIVLSEKRDRDSVGLREFVAEVKTTLAGTLLPNRIPIGTAEVVGQAKRDRFAAYYDTWYRPERIALIAVGDFEPDTLVKQITDHFASFKARGPAKPSPDLGKIAPVQGLRAFWHREAEAGNTRVSIQSILPFKDEPDTAASRARHVLNDLAVSMLSRRLDILARKDGAPLTQGSVNYGREFSLFDSTAIELSCKPELWAQALTVSENELRRALQFGFTGSELAEASANLLNTLEQGALTASTRHSSELADEILGALLKGEVFTHPSDDLKLLAPVVKSATPEACTNALRELFANSGYYVTVVGNATVAPTAGEAEQAILATMERAAQVKLEAPKNESAKPFAYTDFGPEGKVAQSKHVDDLDVDLSTFVNGVKYNFKKTDFEVGKVQIFVRVGSGLLSMPKDKAGLNLLANATLVSGGLGQHSMDEVISILAGKTIGARFQAAEDSFEFSAATNREDLTLQLQLFAAFLQDAGYRPEALTQARKQFEQLYLQLQHVPEGPLKTEMPRLLASGDPRFGLPPKADLDQRTLEEVKAWLTPEFTSGPIEITIVGDVDPSVALKSVAVTFGALPKRNPKPEYKAERTVKFPALFSKDFTVVSEIPKAYAYLAWPTTDNRDITTNRQLRLLSEIFTDRLRVKIREELGDAYSPYSMSLPSDTYIDYGSFAAVISASPEKTGIVIDATLAIAKDLVEHGVTQDELERARLPVLTSIREAARTNGYWLQTVLGSAQEFPEHLDWRRTIDSGHAAITKDQIDAIAKKFLSPDRAYRFTVKAGVPSKDHP